MPFSYLSALSRRLRYESHDGNVSQEGVSEYLKEPPRQIDYVSINIINYVLAHQTKGCRIISHRFVLTSPLLLKAKRSGGIIFPHSPQGGLTPANTLG